MDFDMSLLRTKPITPANSVPPQTTLKRCLNAVDLTLFGIGAIIGAGIFVITGVAAATQAGPAIILSYIMAGIACAFTALSYAELASSVGGCGSAYGYAYAALGELIAWIIGWDLILEYSISVSTVAIGWSGYVNNVLTAAGYMLPSALTKGPLQGGIINLPATIIILLLSSLLAVGVKESARFNTIMVFAKLFAILIFIIAIVPHFNLEHWHPFMPFGWEGVMRGAALIFFAYIGFDAVSTAAEETISPQRNLPIGIILSLIICTVIYVIVAGLLTAAAPYSTLNVASPIANVLLTLGHRFEAGVVAVGAIAGLTTVMLVMYYGLTRVFLAMSRDNLLPKFFSTLNPRTHTPVRIILISGILMSLISGLLPLEDVAELVNIGTLAAFVIVCAGVIVLRRTQPLLPRPFRVSFSPWIPLLGIFFCLYLMVSLPLVTWARFITWMLIGLLIYFFYSRKQSKQSSLIK
jgi:APA family basic amino acid/polyamine antiporter